MGSSTPIPIQQGRPFARLGIRRTLLLPLEHIHPLVRIAHLQREPLRIPERIIFDHELVLILHGTGTWEYGGRLIPYGPSDLLFLRPFIPHRFYGAGDTSSAHIAVHFDFAPGVPDWTEPPDEAGAWPPYQVHLTHGMQIPERISLTPGGSLEEETFALLAEWQTESPLGPLAVGHHLLTLLIGLLRAGENVPALPDAQNRARIALIVAHVRRHLSRPHTASELAEVAGVSASRLNVLFREHTGRSLMAHVQHLRVDEARRLLADIRLSIKEIAALTGFHDTYHFSKAFRRVDGLSPLYYRQALLAGREARATDESANGYAK